MNPSAYLKQIVLGNPYRALYSEHKPSEARNIVDCYYVESDATRFLGYYDFLMFVLFVAEDIADTSPYSKL